MTDTVLFSRPKRQPLCYVTRSVSSVRTCRSYIDITTNLDDASVFKGVFSNHINSLQRFSCTAQILEIQQASLSRLICDNSLQDDNAQIQNNAFIKSGG